MPLESPHRTDLTASRPCRESFYWAVALGTVLLTWSTLYWAPFLSDWFRDRGWINGLIIGLFAFSAAVVVVLVLRRRPGWREMAVLAVFAVLYFLSVRPLMQRPEEALHFLQYGLVGGFFYAALRERRRQHPASSSRSPLGRFPAASAFLLAAAAGWADEGIQFLLPNRHYDLRDVGFNAAAAALAIGAIAALRWASGQGRTRETRLSSPSN